MKRKKHSPEQVISQLAEGDRMLNEGKTVAEVARAFGISETTWHRWKNTYGVNVGSRHEASQGTGSREPQAKAHGGRPSTRYLDAQGVGDRKLLTPDRRRGAVKVLRKSFGVSERKACRVTSQPRSTKVNTASTKGRQH